MSPTINDYLRYTSLGVGLLTCGGYGNALDASPYPSIFEDSDYVYFGSLHNNDLSEVSGITESGISQYLAQVAFPEEQNPQKLTEAEVPEALRSLKRLLGLSTTDLANICKVSRPTIYSWQNGTSPGLENLNRLNTLNKLANSWSDKIGVSVQRALKITLPPELKKALLQELLDEAVIEGILSRVADDVNTREASRPKSAREIAEEFGLETLPTEMQDTNRLSIFLGAGKGN